MFEFISARGGPRGPFLASFFAACCAAVLCCIGWGALSPTPALAEPDPSDALELWDGRFEVRGTYRDRDGNAEAYVSSAGRQSAVLHFFHPTNPELLVKILDGRSINGHFWVFYGAITTLEVDLEIVDRETGTTRVYRKPDSLPLGGADVVAFPDHSVSSPVSTTSTVSASTLANELSARSRPIADRVSPPKSFGTCVADAYTLCFQGGRFRVSGRWSPDSPDPPDSSVRVARGSDRSGYLWFFDADTPEVLVKVLDGRTVNDSFWVLFGSATHLPFRLVVEDLETGVSKEFTADAFGGGADAFTFGPHGTPPRPPQPPQILAPTEDAVVSPHDPTLVVDAEATFEGADCLDYQILESTPSGERLAWRADCLWGPGSDRPRLDLGEFVGDHGPTGKLTGDAEHRLLVRRRVASETGAYLTGRWASRSFRTGEIPGVYPLVGEGALADPTPTWTVSGQPVHLPDSSCNLRIESGTTPILSFRSAAGGSAAECRIESSVVEASAVRIEVDGCVRRLRLAASEVRWRTPGGRESAAFLPSLDLLLGQAARFDVATSGSTFFADEATEPGILDPGTFEDSGTLDPTRLARHSASPWWLAAGLSIERVATAGLALPVNLTPGPGLHLPPAQASSDDPLFYVTELYGAIRVLRRDGTLGTYADGLLNFDPTGDFPGTGELGLVGTVVDPANGDLLATLVYRKNPDDDAYPKFSGRIVRLPSDDGGRTATRTETVLDLGPDTRLSKSHQISHLSFGPDGMLNVHVGDGFAHQQSQILDNFAGKILRLRPDGTAPPDNPFYDADDGLSAADYVYALGLRNPFGGAWRSDGALYMVENGLSVDRFARVDPGFNFAWGTGGEGTDEQMTVGALFNWPKAVTPFDLVFVPEGAASLPAPWSGLALVSEFGPTYRFGSTDRGKRLALFDLEAESIVPRTALRYDGLGPATVAATAIVNGTPEHDGLYFVDFFPEPFEDPDGDVTAPGARLWRVRLSD